MKTPKEIVDFIIPHIVPKKPKLDIALRIAFAWFLFIVPASLTIWIILQSIWYTRRKRNEQNTQND